jgi:hypothetical protein
MHRAAPWVWMHYARNGCYHHAPIKLDSLIERWGSAASADKLRRNARCAKCGHKGATLSVPSCGPGCGDAPFPAQGCPMCGREFHSTLDLRAAA